MTSLKRRGGTDDRYPDVQDGLWLTPSATTIKRQHLRHRPIVNASRMIPAPQATREK